MKPIIQLITILLVTGACYQQPEPGIQPSGRAEPMEARIIPRSPGVGLRISVSRPAYAALYQIVPGAGVSQVYPGLGTGNMDGRVFSGYTSLNGVRLANIEQYAPAMGSGPRFYFLLTSDRPLDIDRFGTFGIGLRRELGYQFTAFNAFETMERLAEMTLPAPGDQASWSSDFYVDWPNVLYSAPVPGMTLVPLRCGSYQMYVPVDRLMEVDSRLCHPEPSPKPETPETPQTPPTPTDSAAAPTAPAKPVEPTPARRATSRQASNATSIARVRERLLASSQLEANSSSARSQDQNGRSRRMVDARARRGEQGARSSGIRSNAARSGSQRDAASSSGSTSGSVTVTSARARPQPDAPAPAPVTAPAPASTPQPASAPASTPHARPAVLPDSNG